MLRMELQPKYGRSSHKFSRRHGFMSCDAWIERGAKLPDFDRHEFSSDAQSRWLGYNRSESPKVGRDQRRVSGAEV
jgi:hypothetical protein